MKSVMLGAVLNIVLDPVFIFALDMGVRGGGPCHRAQPDGKLRVRGVRFCCFARRAPVSITFGGYEPARDGPRAGAGLYALSDYCHG